MHCAYGPVVRQTRWKRNFPRNRKFITLYVILSHCCRRHGNYRHQLQFMRCICVSSQAESLSLCRPLSSVGEGEQPGTAQGLNAKQERCVWFATAFAANDRCMRRVMSTKLKLWHDGLCTFVLPREK